MATKNRNTQGKRKPVSSRRRPKYTASRSIQKTKKIRVVDPTDPYDRALSRVKEGETQKSAAKAEGVSVKVLRNFMRKNTRSKWVNGKWDIKDRRAVYMFIFEEGQVRSIPVGRKAATAIGHYWNAVNRFLETNDASHLLDYRNASVRDAYNKSHRCEIDPNVLRRGDSVGDLSFHTVYAKTVI